MELVFGYCRVSTRKQVIDRQVSNILAKYPGAKIYQETYTGTKVDGRKAWNRLKREALQAARHGDDVTIVFDEVSRMARNAEEGFQLYEELFDAGIHLVFLKDALINTDTYKQAVERQLTVSSVADKPTNELLQTIVEALNRYIMELAKAQIYLAFKEAENEVTYLHQRTSEGIHQAKLAGKRIGTQTGDKFETKKARTSKKVILEKSKTFGGYLSDTELMKVLDISRVTYYKYKKELKEAVRVEPALLDDAVE